MEGKLALILTGEKYIDYVTALIDAASRKGLEVSVFMTDKGVSLTGNGDFVSMLKRARAKVSICEFSCKSGNITDKIDGFNYGSQFDNAKMVGGLTDQDRLLIF